MDINHDGLSIDEMKEAIRAKADKEFAYKKFPISIKEMSTAMLKFLTQEYDFVIKNKDGKEVTVKEVK